MPPPESRPRPVPTAVRAAVAALCAVLWLLALASPVRADAANGVGAVLTGRPVPTPTITPGADDPGASGNDGGIGGLVPPLVAVAAAGALAAYTRTRRKRRMSERTTPQAWGRQDVTPPPDRDEQAGRPTGGPDE